MAAYLDLYNLHNDPDLIGKVSIAIAIACEAIRTEPASTANHAQRMNWAQGAIANPDNKARAAMWMLLAQNQQLTIQQMQGATDAQIQTAVNTIVDFASSV